MANESMLPSEIDSGEFLYRGVLENQWDQQKNRPSSAAYKDSCGVSVNRDALIRDLQSSINALLGIKPFKAVCRVMERKVRESGALTKYLPVPENVYHCEIHDSEEKISLSASKARKVRDSSEVVYLASID